MSIAIAQMRCQMGQVAANKQQMLQLIEQAKQLGAEVAVFPELALPGYFYDDLLASPGLLEDCEQAIADLAQAATGITVIFGSIVHDQGQLLSQAYLLQEGKLMPIAAAAGAPLIKGAATPGYAAAACQPIRLSIDGRERNILVLLGNWQGQKLPTEAPAADLLLYLSPQLMLAEEGLKPPTTGIATIQVGGVGLLSSGKANYLLAGHSSYYDESGRLLAEAPYFEQGLFCWQLHKNNASHGVEKGNLLSRSLVMGVREFCRSIKASRAVIGISGGIDSALAACIYREALGADNVYLLSLPTHFNSETTKSLAARMAEGLGLSFATMPLDKGLEGFYQACEATIFSRGEQNQQALQLSGAVKENIMARERARYLAAAAAVLQAVFTCNGNKAELSVGYATFYGDLAGAFAAQADLWKYQVYQAAGEFQGQFPEAPLVEIATIKPSAELSAAQDVDKGLGDPLIYPYHDYLLKSWVEQGETPYDTLLAYEQGRLEEHLGCEMGLSAQLFATAGDFVADVERWWGNYRTIGIAKRLQAPPLLALSRQPFGEALHQLQAGVMLEQRYLALKEKLVR